MFLPQEEETRTSQVRELLRNGVSEAVPFRGTTVIADNINHRMKAEIGKGNRQKYRQNCHIRIRLSLSESLLNS